MTNKEIKEFIRQTCCPFLAARKWYWLRGTNEKQKYIKGKNFYLENAYNYLKSQEFSIKNGEFLAGEEYDPKYKQQIINWASKAYDRKIKELEEVMVK